MIWSDVTDITIFLHLWLKYIGAHAVMHHLYDLPRAAEAELIPVRPGQKGTLALARGTVRKCRLVQAAG